MVVLGWGLGAVLKLFFMTSFVLGWDFFCVLEFFECSSKIALLFEIKDGLQFNIRSGSMQFYPFCWMKSGTIRRKFTINCIHLICNTLIQWMFEIVKTWGVKGMVCWYLWKVPSLFVQKISICTQLQNDKKGIKSTKHLLGSMPTVNVSHDDGCKQARTSSPKCLSRNNNVSIRI